MLISKEAEKRIMKHCRMVCDAIHTNKMLDGSAYMFAMKGVEGHIQLLRDSIPILGTSMMISMHPDQIRDSQIFITIYNRLNKVEEGKSELLAYSKFLDEIEQEIKSNMGKIMSVNSMPKTFAYFQEIYKFLELGSV